jgi:vesicle-fusing ATPase
VSQTFQLLTGLSVAVCTRDFPQARPGSDILLLINDLYVFSARPLDSFPQGGISFSDPQRTWAGVALTDSVKVQMYDPFSQGGQAYLGSSDIEVGFAGKKRTDMPYDQDELSNVVIKVSHSLSGLHDCY